ncbi:vWA domain-containing protein [Mesohalobacter halotolerans]|uniref:VWA domain-containing protein n=1 Tax=Mesohalobacter halotolerans TaxID=1883405 RepID=A0A4U5TPZ8_9FLAO|nr:vWA domain-containing protein [Mesohalobacter halotolerans]MBS3739177.1 VWA domain-containing protein [Psychroflexus sp.]TKS56260.1 VWA domain-containing protein [Mesohalobacter halotolerans]
MDEFDVLWIILIVILSLGLTWFQYQNQFKGQFKRAFIFAFPRFLAYLCLGILLLNPQIKQTTYFTEKPNLVIGLDNSMSIAQLIDTASYKSNLLKWINDKEIADGFNIQRYQFGENYATFERLNFIDKQSNISGFIRQMSNIYRSNNSHIVLFTDGQQTLGQDYLYTTKSSQQNLIPVVVGDTTNYTDLKIDRINANRYAFLNNQFPIEVFLSSNTEKEVNTEFVLKRQNKVIARKSVSFSEDIKAQNFKIYLKANQFGVNTITAELKPVNEKNTQNNIQQFAVEVIDERTKILLLYNTLHPDLGLLKKSIESNQQHQVKLQNISDLNEDLATFNLVIFYQPEANFQEIFKTVQSQNLSYIVIGGTQTDYSVLNRSQPYFKKTLSRATEDYYPKLNPSYSSYQVEDIGFANFPPLKNTFGDIEMTSESDILLIQNINGISTQQPLLMTVSENNQKSAFLFGENIWRWRMYSFIDQGDFKAFDRFIDQLVQFVSSQTTKSRLVTDVESFYNQGENSNISVQYFDKNYNFDPDQKINLQVTNTTSQEKYSYTFVLKNQNYKTKINDLPAGEYNYKINVEKQNISESGQFTVIDFVLEQQFYRANVEKLQQLSDTLFYANQLDKLKTYLTTQQKFKPLQKSLEKKESLIEWWMLFILIIVFLGIEWFSRKYHGLI